MRVVWAPRAVLGLMLARRFDSTLREGGRDMKGLGEGGRTFLFDRRVKADRSRESSERVDGPSTTDQWPDHRRPHHRKHTAERQRGLSRVCTMRG